MAQSVQTPNNDQTNEDKQLKLEEANLNVQKNETNSRVQKVNCQDKINSPEKISQQNNNDYLLMNQQLLSFNLEHFDDILEIDPNSDMSIQQKCILENAEGEQNRTQLENSLFHILSHNSKNISDTEL